MKRNLVIKWLIAVEIYYFFRNLGYPIFLFFLCDEMKRLYLYILIFYFSFAEAQVGGERIYNFLNIPSSARQAALGGEIYTLRNDVNQPLWNPSMIDETIDNQASVGYVNYLADVNIGAATFAHMINRHFGTLQAGIQFIDYGDFIAADENGMETGDFSSRDLAFSVGYAYQFPRSDFYAGINGKLISSKIENFTSFGAAFDMGMYYYSQHKPYTFTAVIRNLGYQLSPFTDERENLPFEVAAGASYKVEDVPITWHLTLSNLQKWNLAVPNPSNGKTDLDGNTEEENINFFDNAVRHVVVGAEFFPGKNFNIRLGYNFRRAAELKLTQSRTFAGISAGFGIEMGRIRFDYAFTKYHPVTNTSTFTLIFDLTRRGF